jgi:hypothetical protein
MTLPFPVEPGRPGAARVEYRACKEDVEVLLAKGYSYRMAWEEMAAQGRVRCSYSAFCDYVRGQGKRRHGRKKTTLNALRQRSATNNAL